MENESLAQALIRFFFYLRRFLLEFAISFIVLTFIIYWFSPQLLSFLEGHLDQRLVFFGVTEPIVSLLKLSGFTAIFLMCPWLFLRISQGLSAVFGLSRSFTLGFTIMGLILFYSGVAFCYLFTLPFGINFLLGYQSEHLKPVISIERFVDFVSFFLIGFGLIFELPLVMTVMAKLRLCTAKTFSSKRRYAILIIAIIAAMLTPTPDVINMALMGIPLYLLFEAGIIFTKMVASESPS